ncbi:TniQ family protein [Butyrivibrio sp. AC2005]|uniref:TniQ family protein n=1 Tax=Butyrivibrio sp. AC2005 TaxID=1280672 RepID=UPI000402AA2F|nr:TniQ family protein [Butyrivibrio sp. AC2005]
MIGSFPEAYPDELLHSVYARYFVRSGYPAYTYALQDLFGSAKNSIEFTPRLTYQAAQVLKKVFKHNIETIIEEHTMFSYYARFISSESKVKALNYITEGNGKYVNILPLPAMGERYLRYCPLCAKEDREQYGETYWNRKHQIPGVPVCPKHGCQLENTNIHISGKTSPRLFVAEVEVPYDMPVIEKMEDNSIELARYIEKIVDLPMEYKPNDAIGTVLQRYLYPPYTATWSGRIEYKQICEGLQEYYKNDVDMPIISKEQVYKVFGDKKRNPLWICQIACFLKISPELIAFPQPHDETQQQILSEIVKILHKEHGMPYTKIAEGVCMSVEDIRSASKRNYMHKYRRKFSGKRGNLRRIDWEKYDIDRLDEVKRVSAEIYGNNGNRPHRVTLMGVEKTLGIPSGRLKRMPKCLSVIQSYSETQEEYWVREVLWCIKKLESDDTPLVWRRIRDTINIDKASFMKILPMLEENLSEEQVLVLTSGFKV